MPSLSEILSSNARISTSLPSGLVAVFVGATNGIGETTLRQFAKHAKAPRVYFLGRSQEAGDRITKELKTLNAGGEFRFIKADLSLIRNVDDVCKEIKSKEKAINLLFMTQGTMIMGKETSENLHFASALIIYSRVRFIQNLLPLLQNATGLRRVVSVFTGTKEGPINFSDFQGRKITKPVKQRGHASTILTLSLEALQKQAPEVSFVHGFPGFVKSGITRGTTGVIMGVVKAVFAVMAPFYSIPLEEAGERHVFLATSAKFCPEKDGSAAAGVPLEGAVSIARDTRGVVGGGVYSIDDHQENQSLEVEALLEQLRKEGASEKVWETIESDIKQATAVG